MSPETLAWIEKQKPELVGWAEAYVKETKLFAATRNTARKPHGKRSPEVRTNQLRNLLNAAQSGSPLAVLINFLRYQIGREAQGWKHRTSGEKLHDLLHDSLRGLCQKGCDHYKETHDKRSKSHQPDHNDEFDRFEMEAHLAAQLMGFIIREYTYRCCLEGTRP